VLNGFRAPRSQPPIRCSHRKCLVASWTEIAKNNFFFHKCVMIRGKNRKSTSAWSGLGCRDSKKEYLKIIYYINDDKFLGWAAGRTRRNLAWIWNFQHLNGTSRKGCLYVKRPLEQVCVPSHPFSTLMGTLRIELKISSPCSPYWNVINDFNKELQQNANVRHWRSRSVFIKHREHSMDFQHRLFGRNTTPLNQNIGPYSS